MDSMERLPRLEHKVTPKGDLFRLTKPGTSMRLFLNARELEALVEQGSSLLQLPTNNLTHR